MHDDVRAYLERLAAELQRRGWSAELQSDGRLLVTNPDTDDLQELIGCRRLVGGWEFYWSWGDPVGPVEDLVNAADRIVRVLRAVGVDGPVSD
jgi:hypothetical protein